MIVNLAAASLSRSATVKSRSEAPAERSAEAAESNAPGSAPSSEGGRSSTPLHPDPEPRQIPSERAHIGQVAVDVIARDMHRDGQRGEHD